MFTFTNQVVRGWAVARWLLAALLLAGLATPAVAAPALAPGDTTKREPLFARRRLMVQYDSRYSIINDHFCTINGLKLGVTWRGRVRSGAAVYFLSSGIPTRQNLPDNAADTAHAQLRFRYLALYGEYVIIENTRWELSANLQTGLGSVYVLYKNDNNVDDRTPRDFIGLIEPSVATQMRLFPWASLGAGAGWRQPVFVPETIRREISGPVFYVRANILIGALVRTARRHERLFTQDGIRVRGLRPSTRQKFYGQ